MTDENPIPPSQPSTPKRAGRPRLSAEEKAARAERVKAAREQRSVQAVGRKRTAKQPDPVILVPGKRRQRIIPVRSGGVTIAG